MSLYLIILLVMLLPFVMKLTCLGDGTEKPLSTVGSNMDSVVAKLGSEAIAVGHDNEIIPLSPEGDAIWNSGIKFDQIPSLIEYDEPYILALTDTSVEVRI